jgi:hypothetical protein
MTNKKEFEESITSTIKVICQIENLNVNFNLENADFVNLNQNSFLENTISLPRISSNNLDKTRGFADLAALYFKFHNYKINDKIKLKFLIKATLKIFFALTKMFNQYFTQAKQVLILLIN